MNVHRRIAHGLKGLDTDLLRTVRFAQFASLGLFKIIPFIFYVLLRKNIRKIGIFP
jgi:hypothetical protein